MRRLLPSLLAVLVCALHASGQETYRAEISAPLSPGGDKMLRSDLRTLDESFTLTVQGVLLEIALRAELTDVQLNGFLASSGVTVAHFTHVPGTAVASTSRSVGDRPWPVDFPVRLDTGDPLTDDATYEEQKRTWIATYPDLYRQMTEPTPAEPDLEPE